MFQQKLPGEINEQCRGLSVLNSATEKTDYPSNKLEKECEISPSLSIQ